MAFHVSRITGDVDVLPDAFAVDDNGDSGRTRTAYATRTQPSSPLKDTREADPGPLAPSPWIIPAAR